MVATRAAVDRCGPGHVAPPLSPTGTEEGQGRGGGFRVQLCGEDPEASPSPGGRAPCTIRWTWMMCLPPGARGRTGCLTCPDRRSESRGASWSRLFDFVPVVPLLHVPAPQTVDSVVEVLKILDNLLPDVEQAIEVPKNLQHTGLAAFLSPGAADGRTVGGQCRPIRTPCCLSSRVLLRRLWRTSWWKCRRSCLSLSASSRVQMATFGGSSLGQRGSTGGEWAPLTTQWAPPPGYAARPGRDINTGRRDGG